MESRRKCHGIQVIGKGRGYLEAVRADGLRIFLDGDPVLDKVRTNAKDPRVVILAVAYRRAQQIACNYASKHAPSLLEDIRKIVQFKSHSVKLLPQRKG